MSPARPPERLRFHGTIAGLGTTSGVRVVVGSWTETPFGAFDDVMLAESDGTRRLLAPTAEVAAFLAMTYLFDDVAVMPIRVRRDWSFVRVVAGELDVRYLVGGRTPLGVALRAVPTRVAEASWWTHVTDPVASTLMRGVHTRGRAGNERTETYSATDHHAITRAMGSWRGADLGELAPVSPDPGFGFGSTPERPSLTTLVSTVEIPARATD
ncbi:MAG: hypothetical protein QM747_05860 [Nocardioides sp.]